MSLDQVCPSFHLLFSCSCPRFALSVRLEPSPGQRVAADYPLKHALLSTKTALAQFEIQRYGIWPLKCAMIQT